MDAETRKLVERLEFIATSKFEDNYKVGRRGAEYAIGKEIEWQAAQAIRKAYLPR